MIDTSNLIALVDTREQAPLDLGDLRTERRTLHYGDYSLAGMEDLVRIERKSLADFVQCCGKERARFKRSLQALRGFIYHAVVIEASWADLNDSSQWFGSLKPAHVKGMAVSLSKHHNVVFAGNAQGAGEWVATFLRLSAQEYFARCINAGIPLGELEALRK